MEYRISATELSRRVGDVLGRVRFRGDSFVVDRNGDPVARISPLPGATLGTAQEFVDVGPAGEVQFRRVPGLGVHVLSR
jgi:antitoxin (DNA-binding transcriptional repressor) of toxin-antitoxin stability system